MRGIPSAQSGDTVQANPRDVFSDLRGSQRNAGVAGTIVADVSRSPVRSGVMLTPSRRVTPN